MTLPPGEAAGLVRDPATRAALRAARSWGVSPSTFLGHTRPRYRVERDAGAVVGLVGVDPVWTETDRELAVALEAYEADTCGGCGLQLAETTDPGNEGWYTAGQPIRCHGCVALAQGTKPYGDDWAPESLRFPVSLRPPRPAQEEVPGDV